MLKISPFKNYSNVSLPAKMGKIYGSQYARLCGTPTFWTGPPFSNGTFFLSDVSPELLFSTS